MSVTSYVIFVAVVRDRWLPVVILIGNSYSIFISQLNSLRVIDSKWRKVVEAEYFA